MKRIGILSDTHSTFDERLREVLADTDELWHAGDFASWDTYSEIRAFKPLRAVYGNCDGELLRHELLEVLCFEMEGIRFAMMHRGGEPRHYSPQALRVIHTFEPQVLIAGHTHHYVDMEDEVYNLRFLNPGEAGQATRQGFRSVIILDLDRGKICHSEVRKF